MKIIAMHQPDFLPYSGFFYKYFKADVFDLAIYDQFSPSGYHRRVKMGGEWVTMPCKGLNKLPRETRICDIEVYRERAIAMLIGAIDRTYRNSPHYRKVRRSLVAWISDWTKNETDETMKLYLFNEMLLHLLIILVSMTTTSSGKHHPQPCQKQRELSRLCRRSTQSTQSTYLAVVVNHTPPLSLAMLV